MTDYQLLKQSLHAFESGRANDRAEVMVALRARLDPQGPDIKRVEQLAEYLNDNARSPLDNDAAALLRRLASVHDVATEMVRAKTHAQSKAAYLEMIDLIKGKQGV